MYCNRSIPLNGLSEDSSLPLGHGGSPRPRSILVVDDTASAREPLTRLLRMAGYDASSVKDGNEALDAIEARRPDLVLLDLMMPRMDGLDFLRHLRKDHRWDDLAIVVVTAAENPDQIAAAKSLGAQDCLIKAAFTVPELLERIARALGS